MINYAYRRKIKGDEMMETISNLIKRARELTALAKGDYEAIDWSWIRDAMYRAGYDKDDISNDECKLMSASWEMARLLAEMADALEEARRSTLEDAIGTITCEACDGRGRVAWNPNSQPCPVCDGSGLVDDPVGAIEELMIGIG